MPNFLDRLLGRSNFELTPEQIERQQGFAGRLAAFQDKYAEQLKIIGEEIDRSGIRLRDPSSSSMDKATLLANAEDNRDFFRLSVEQKSPSTLKASEALQRYMDGIKNLIWDTSESSKKIHGEHMLYRETYDFLSEALPSFRALLNKKPELAATMQPAYDELMVGVETELLPLLKDVKRFRLATTEWEVALEVDDPVGDRSGMGR